MKFRRSIDLSVIDEVREKVGRLTIPARGSVRTGLIYEGELDPRVAETDFFDHIIPIARLLS